MNVELLDMRLGRVKIAYDPDEVSLAKIKNVLVENEFELITDKESQIAEQIKAATLGLLQNIIEGKMKGKKSDYLSKAVGYNYYYLSRLFTKHEGLSIERYIILLKVEKVKEWLEYGEMTVSEIAHKLDYSSVQHLSKQFREATGISVSDFRKFIRQMRKPLDKLVSK